MVGPTAGPAVPVLDVAPVGPAPSAVSDGITTPRREDRGGTGSAASTGDDACAGGGGLVAQESAPARRAAAAIAGNRLAIGEAT